METMTQELTDYVQELKLGDILWNARFKHEKAVLFDERGDILELDDDFYFEVLETMKPHLWRSDWTFLSAKLSDTARLYWEFDDHFFVRQLTLERLTKFCYLAGLPPPR